MRLLTNALASTSLACRAFRVFFADEGGEVREVRLPRGGVAEVGAGTDVCEDGRGVGAAEVGAASDVCEVGRGVGAEEVGVGSVVDAADEVRC